MKEQENYRPIKRRREAERRRAKVRRIRRTISVLTCLFTLAVVLFGIKMVTKVITKSGINAKEAVASNEVQIDENKTQELDTGLESLKVCIDAGHGGKDEGSSSGGRIEKHDTLKLALKIKERLEEKGITVVMTREDDTFLKLAERCQIANSENVDYFVSIHRNKGQGTGVETWISYTKSEESKTLAENIMSQLKSVGVQKDRGVKAGTQSDETKDYYVNGNVKAPSCILELGFIDNAKDNELYDSNMDAYAQAIADGIYQSGKTSESDLREESDSKQLEEEESQEISKNQVTLENEQIENIESLDSAYINWGSGGSSVDENNRPASSVSYQEKYGGYSADFIKEADEGDGKKKIYLTFDEGYENGFTEKILDVLKEKDCHVVFFVTKPYVESNPDLVQRMIDEGHIVGNHSVTHPSEGLPSQSLDDQKFEVTDLHDYMVENFNYNMYLFRYPTGRFSVQSLALLNNLNYRSIFWSFAHYDYDVNAQPDEAESLQKLTSSLHPGAIYLLHAVSQTNTNILGQFIDETRAQGYEFAEYTVK